MSSRIGEERYNNNNSLMRTVELFNALYNYEVEIND